MPRIVAKMFRPRKRGDWKWFVLLLGLAIVGLTVASVAQGGLAIVAAVVGVTAAALFVFRFLPFLLGVSPVSRNLDSRAGHADLH